MLSALTACSGNAGDGGVSLFAMFITPQTQTVDAGQSLPITVSLVNDSTPGGATFSVAGGGTLSAPTTTHVGTTEKVTALYTAPSTVAVSTVATVTITSVNTPVQVLTVAVTVNPALTITSLTLPTATVASAYTTTLAAAGGTGTDTWSIVLGTLPAGLSLDGSTGIISGTPTAAPGSYTFTIGVSDSAGTPTTAVQTFNLTIIPQAPVITTTTLPVGVTGTAYSQQLAYINGSGTAVWSISAGSLPSASGLTLSSSGLISGTPVVANTSYIFSVVVTVGTQVSAPVQLTLSTIAPLVVTTTTLPSGRVGVAYSQQLALSGGNGGTATWSIVSGSLPTSSGLTLSSSGLISGTPTTVTSTPYTFAVSVTVGSQTSAAQTLNLSVTSTIITSASTATGEVALPFAFQLTAIGGTLPYTWSLATGSSALPGGLTLNAATGLISGTPATTAGSPFTNVIVQATDAHGGAKTQTMTITINPARSSANNAELSGQYAFLLSGFDAAGNPLASAGKFTADGNGNITGGVVDVNGTALSAPVSATLSAATYSVGADNRGKLTLSRTGSTTTYVISLNSFSGSSSGGIAAAGTITEFDVTGQSLTGVIALQTPAAFNTASITGGFAFGEYGFAANNTAATLQRRAAIGEIQFNGTSVISSAELLATALGSTPVVPASGALTVASSGRGTLSLVLPNSGGTINLVAYVVSATKLFLLSADPASGTGSARDLLSGTALAQTIANGSFGNASLNAIAIARTQALGVNSSGGFYPDAQLAIETFDGAGKITIAADEDAGGVVTANSLYGTYSVATNGRVTAYLYPSGNGGCIDCGKIATYYYLAGANQGFSMDFTNALNGGYFEPQTATGFTAASFSGSYSAGSIQPLVQGAVYQSGYATSSGAGAVTGVEDQNAAGTLSPDQSFSASYTVNASGRIAFTPSGTPGPVLYIISPTKGLLLDLSSATPVIQEVIHQ